MKTSLIVRLVGWLWFAAAILAGRFLLLQHLSPPAIQGLLASLTILLLAAYFRLRPFRTWVDALDLRVLVALHLTRFVGFYFIYLSNRGALPYAFAVPGGVGDIAVAAMAFIVIVAPFSTATRQRAVFIWNVVGLIDILMVVVSAIRLNLADPSSLRALTYLPVESAADFPRAAHHRHTRGDFRPAQPFCSDSERMNSPLRRAGLFAALETRLNPSA